MKLTHLLTAGLTLSVPVAGLGAQAQTSGTRFGVAAAYLENFNLGVGAFAKFHLTELDNHPITGRASFDYFFPGTGSDCTYYYCGSTASYSRTFWQASLDGLYDVANAKSDMKPYLGAGLSLSHYSTDATCFVGGIAVPCAGGSGGLGLNVLGGLNFMANSTLMPFVEIKLDLGGGIGPYGGSGFELKGGIHLH
jgi:hypothetical protein